VTIVDKNRNDGNHLWKIGTVCKDFTIEDGCIECEDSCVRAMHYGKLVSWQISGSIVLVHVLWIKL